MARPFAVLVLCALLGQGCRSAASPVATMPAPASPGAPSRAASSDLRQQWLDMFARGYFPGRSGQVFFVPQRGDFVVGDDELYAFMHGSPWDYDTRIPLLLHGPGFIRAGHYGQPVTQQHIAPTLAALLGLPALPTFTGRALTEALEPGAERPRVILLFVLDGMRADYFDTYAAVMPTLGRLRAEGAWFADARANSLPTLTAVGHATVGTGTDPRVHGLAVNNLFNRVTGEAQPAYQNLDPGELMALTLADTWNLATDGRAIIIGQGGAIRAVAGLVGRGRCAINGRAVLAASYSARTGGWETNPDCYTLPAVLERLNARPYWEDAGGRWLGHDIAGPSRFRSSALFQRFEGDALMTVLESTAIGADDVTDLVLVNVKGPDYVAHAFGPASAELRDTLGELDRQLARALALVEDKAGRGRSVVAVTADHGMPGEPEPGGRRIRLREIAVAIDRQFTPTGPSIVQFLGDPANAQIYLDTTRLATMGHTLKDVAVFLEERFFAAAFTEDEVRAASARLPLGH